MTQCPQPFPPSKPAGYGGNMPTASAMQFMNMECRVQTPNGPVLLDYSQMQIDPIRGDVWVNALGDFGPGSHEIRWYGAQSVNRKMEPRFYEIARATLDLKAEETVVGR